MSRDLFLRAAGGERTERPPVWLMRQAGRYLPEYRRLREDHSFLDAVTTPEVAAEISLQPYERFRPDGVVMFSDILPALEPLGFSYHLEEGVGPVVENPVEGPEDVDRERGDVAEDLDYVGDLLERLSERVDDAAVIGFAGGPFSLASYAIPSSGSRARMPVRRFRHEHPEAFCRLIAQIADVVGEYLRFQADRGADVVQLFDTYAGGLLSPADYREFLLPLHREILAGVPVPTIAFVRNVPGLDLLAETGADVVGLDWTTAMSRARTVLDGRPVQGNLDPAALFAPPARVRERTETVIEAAGPRGHILNLGHGVNRATPVESVDAFVETAKEWTWE